MTRTTSILLLLVFLTPFDFSLPSAAASENDHRYSVGDDVPLFVNKVGPLNNPSETYEYYDLPFCRPDYLVRKKESLREVLNGDRLTNTLYNLKFREDKNGEILCHKKLKRDEIAKFRDVITNEYYFQMDCDDLPFWGFIGKMEEESWAIDRKGPEYYLFRHVQFNVFYNANQIIEIHAFSDPNHIVDITGDSDTDVIFTYSVFWNATSTQFDSRMERYSRAALQATHWRIHWFSFINSIVTIVLLTGVLMVLFVHHLKNDLKKFASGDEEDKEVGWKYIQGDVFRCPIQMPLFCAILGSGTQLLTLVFLLFALAFLGIIYPYNRGALGTSLVVIYALTSTISGYCSASFYSRFIETGWEKSVLLAGFIYLGPLFVTAAILNTIAIYYGATAALPFGTIVVIFLLFVLLNIPLLAIGGMIGHQFRSEYKAPSTTKRFPREIPTLAWYRKMPGQMFLGGLLPFSAIALELHNLYASMWGYKIYTLSAVVFVTFIILIVLVAMLSVGLTYIQLTAEDHEWWWRSVLRGGFAAIFMFGYTIYFYAKSNMMGFLQLSFFYGYSACLCYAFFLMLSTVSFYASLVFVRHIYHAVKNE
ncbi:hypothetical protein NMG60_11033387 [Bertholletia excelsa]